MEVSISDWDLIQEFERRLENHDIIRTKNGKFWPTHCPKCGSTLTEHVFKVEIPEPIAKNWTPEQWDTFDKEMNHKAPYGTQKLRARKSGTYYCVTCDDAASDFGDCNAFPWDWHTDLDDAREEFFEHNMED